MRVELAKLGGAMVRAAVREDQREALDGLTLLSGIVVRVAGDRPPQHPEPSRVVGRPVDVLERHADDVGAEGAGAAPQELLGDGAAGEVVLREVRIDLAGEHPARDLRLPRVPRRAGIDPSSVLLDERDHLGLAAVVGAERG